MTMTGVLSRRVLADQVKDRILEGILTGHYPPDSRIIETQVARELGTSQAPVREALRGLEGLGFVEITPFRGARVRRPSRREIIDAYAVRSTLESLGARLAVPRMTETNLIELAGLLDAMRVAAAGGDGHAVAEADARFHGRIVELADNATLEKVWRSLEPFSRTYITLAVPGADARWSADLHAPILEALRRHDVEAVVGALQRHFDEVSAHLGALWPDDDPEGAASAAIDGASASDGAAIDSSR